ncbi:hypothetical protein MRB53_040479 [Persea americana]|nr:hypothetical protein MRB53_040479 [Persea americana]
MFCGASFSTNNHADITEDNVDEVNVVALLQVLGHWKSSVVRQASRVRQATHANARQRIDVRGERAPARSSLSAFCL